MTRDKEKLTRLLRVKPDEAICHKVRNENGFTTIRQFNLYYSLYESRTLTFAYFKEGVLQTTGTISKSEVFTAMRKLAVEYR
jgi:hypothetical protein